MATNPFIKENRDSLTHFVEEQLLGPGACGDNYGIDDMSINGEVLNTTPGSVYCTGILFPSKTIAESEVATETAESDNVDKSSLGNDQQAAIDQNPDLNENSSEDDASNDEDSLPVNQRYPQSFAISVCFNKTDLKAEDLILKVYGRYYRRIEKETKARTYARVDNVDIDGVKALSCAEVSQGEYHENMAKYFRLEDDKLFLLEQNNKMHGLLKDCLDRIDQIECQKIAEQESLTKPLFNSLRFPQKRRGEEQKERKVYLTTYKESLFGLLRDKSTVQQDINVINGLITRIERIESCLSYFREIVSLLDAKDYGFWYSEDFCKEIDLTGLDLSLGNRYKKSIKDSPTLAKAVCFDFQESEKDNDEDGSVLVNKQASLSINLQLAKDSRNDLNSKTYLKIQVVNTSDDFKETPKKYYSIVTSGVNMRCFFGVKIEVISPYLSPYTYRGPDDYDEIDHEAEKLKYTHRNIHDYGVGHLCSVNWDDKSEPKKVWSDFLPHYDLPDVDTTPKVVFKDGNHEIVRDALEDTSILGIKRLSTLENAVSNEDVIKGLEAFVEAYKHWIDITLVDSEHPEMSGEIRDECLNDYNRMRSNLGLLSDATNMLIFRLMNTAMFMQMWHSQKDNRESLRGPRRAITNEAFYRACNPDVYKTGYPTSWRPFQLAFILINLDGIIQRKDDPNWEKRNNLVDLVWFPTGGGKTEAYLGLIALTIINRRIKNANKPDEGAGTTAIMRYTLRLLTTQQFQRATLLILALEQMRQWGTYNLGTSRNTTRTRWNSEISIGLYLGESALPNHITDLKKEYREWNRPNGKSRIPIKECPWCGGQLSWDDSSAVFKCPSCTFSHRLPILLCDDLIYRHRPTLLFGTVDKFAMISHRVSTEDAKEDSRRLFNSEDGLAPDLIIQDELHLMQGTLGSAVGLFECAIDNLSTREIRGVAGKINVRPKVISSTATTRNTKLQVKALYNREINVFPKSGIDYNDSFYAFYKRDAEERRRRYIGVMPTGRTSMFVQVRLAACCFVHRAVFEKNHLTELNNRNEKYIYSADNYYSLISYFNSLKEVGTTDVQFYSEFTKYTRRLFRRVLRPGNMLQCFYTYDKSLSRQELTGRLGAEDVVSAFEDVKVGWSPDKRLPYSDDQGNRYPLVTPPDLILATNMISVGLDVSRLNLMIVNSMPRNKAEYIQASSRVARKELGIVFTLHNPFRARDVSHFERFREFHEKLYYYVEPISITPFSSKAIEKYMPLVLSAIIRHKEELLANNSSAANLDDKLIRNIICRIEQYFNQMLPAPMAQQSALSTVFTHESYENIIAFVERALKEWEDSQPQKYSGLGDVLYTSTDACEEDRESTLWVVPKSLRVVPAGSVVNIDNSN